MASSLALIESLCTLFKKSNMNIIESSSYRRKKPISSMNNVVFKDRIKATKLYYTLSTCNQNTSGKVYPSNYLTNK